MSRTPTIIEKALEIAEQYPVFPCDIEKAPIVAGGFKAATQDHDEIVNGFSRRNAALIGVPTGKVSGLAVIDVDIKDGKQGKEWVEKHAEMLGITLKAETPSGGWHYYYKHEEGLRNSAGIDGCVDIRAEGGYVCFPDNVNYRFLNDEELADWPAGFGASTDAAANKSRLNLTNPMDTSAMAELRDSYDLTGWNRIISTLAYNAFDNGWSDAQFREFVSTICDQGSQDPDLAPIIKSARRKTKTTDTGDTTPIAEPVSDALPLAPIGMIDPMSLTPPQIIHGLDYIAGTISLTVAAGGVGKSLMMIYEACQMASQGIRVMLLMLEDDPNEVRRRIHACLTFHSLNTGRVAENLIILTNEARLTMATTEHNKPVAVHAGRLRDAIKQFGVKVVIADPFVQTHEMNENDNGQINFVADQFRSIAKELQVAIMLVHHTRKGSEFGARGENARGASALKDAARSVRELRTPSSTEHATFNIAADKAHEIVVIDHTKANYTKQADMRFMQKVVVDVPCGALTNLPVATVRPYEIETYEDLVTDEHRERLKQMITHARTTEQAYVQNVRGNARDLYADAATQLGLPTPAIKKLVQDMLNANELGERRHNRQDKALYVVGVE